MRLSVITPSIRPQFLDITQKALERQTFTDFQWNVEIGLHTRGFMLPTHWNRLLRRSQGEVIVLLEDCIDIPPDTLEKIAALDHTKMAFTYPLQRVKAWGETGSYDWRKHKAEVTGEKLTPNYWEIDFASAPRSLFYDVGGFDEDFNNGWSWENVEIAWRAAAAGYTFYVKREPEGVVLDHDAIIENPFRNKIANNDKRANETRKRAEHGDFKLNYLS